MSSIGALRAQVTAQRAAQKRMSWRRLAAESLAALFSFETLFILYIFAGMYKNDPRLAAIPGDLTAIMFGFSVLCGMYLIYRNGLKVHPRALNFLWIFFALVLWVMVSMLWSPSVFYAQRKALLFPALTTWVIFASAFIIAPDERRVRRFFAMLTAFALFISWESIWALRQNFISGNFRNLIRVLGSHYGTLGVVIGNGALLLLLYYLYYARRWLTKALLLTLIAGIMVMLLVLGSRASLVFPVVASLIPLWLRLRLPRTAGGMLRLVFVAAIGLALVVTMWTRLVDSIPGGPATIKRFVTLGRRGIESEGRFRNIENALKITNQATIPQLVFGHGAGSWPLLIGEGDYQTYPHNLTVEVGIEFGLVGLVLFWGLIIFAVRTLGPLHVIRHDPVRVFILAVGFSFFIVSNVSGDLHENRAFFMMVGLTMYGASRMSPPYLIARKANTAELKRLRVAAR